MKKIYFTTAFLVMALNSFAQDYTTVIKQKKCVGELVVTPTKEYCGKVALRNIQLKESFEVRSASLAKDSVSSEKVFNSELLIDGEVVTKNPGIELVLLAQQAMIEGKTICVKKDISRIIGTSCVDSRQENNIKIIE